MCACGKHMSYMKADHRNYRRKFCSCEKKAWKQKSGLHGIGTLDLYDTGAALVPHHHLKESPRSHRHASVDVASLSRQLETGDGNFFDVHATPVWLYNDGSTPDVRLSFLIVDERTDLRLCIIALHEENTDHNSLTAISFASKLDEVTYNRDLFPIRRKDNDINEPRSQAIQLQPQSKLLGHLTVFSLS